MAQINKILGSPDELKNKKVHKVKIISKKYGAIEGNLQAGIDISYDPQYTAAGDIISLPGVSKLEQFAAVSTGGQLFDGLTTHKQYTGASYINISLALKILDVEGNGLPLNYAKILGSLCQPKKVSDEQIKSAINNGAELLSDGIKKAKSILEKYYNSDENERGNITSEIYEKSKNVADGLTKKAITNLKDRIVTLEISDYLSFDDMVIESVAQSFSYEQGFAGPLYADFTISLSSAAVPDQDKLAKYYKTDKLTDNRIEIVGLRT